MPFLRQALSLGPAGSLGVLAPSGPAAGEPMQLSDPRPRWVSVRFEASPEDAPGRLDQRYGEALPAWLEPDAEPGRVRVTVPAPWVESHLLRGQGVRPGAFSHFTWVFDARTGDVISALFSGVLVRRVGLGGLALDTEVEIRTELTTLAPAGFRRPERLLGNRIVSFCDPSDDASCTAVPPAPYDPRTGYVNAVGFVSARAVRLTTRSFSPLGEARFEELAGESALVQSLGWDDALRGLAPVGAPAPDAVTSTLAAPPRP